MKPTEDLFKLIKSLNVSEKGYFKKFSSLHVLGEKNNYVLLFDTINEQEEYDESAILHKFKHEKFISNFSVAKAYLYNLILKCMRSYRSQSTIKMMLREAIIDSEFLIEKGLYHQGEKILKKSKLIALKHEKFSSFFEISEFEMSIMRQQVFFGKTLGEIEKEFKTLSIAINKYKNIREYELLNTKIYLDYIKKGINRKKEDSLKFSDHHLLQSENNALSNTGLFIYYQCLFIYYDFFRNDGESSYIYIYKLVRFLENHPYIIKEDPALYLNSLMNLVIFQVITRRFSELKKTIEKLRLAGRNSKTSGDMINYVIYNAELSMYRHSGQFEKAFMHAKMTEINLNKSRAIGLDKQLEMALSLNIAMTYFSCGNYRLANKSLTKITQFSSAGFRNDYQSLAKLMLLLVYFEMGKADLLEYAVKSAYRFLLKRDNLYGFETVVLNFIRNKASDLNSAKKYKIAFKELKIQLEKVMQNPLEKKILGAFDFISWLESKIEDRSFAEVIKAKANQFS